MTRAEAIACDVLVVGSGAGGLSAAVTSRVLGLDVVVVEKAPVFGGTTAWSGGWMWIPCNAHQRRAGIEDDPRAARTYLEHEIGADFDAARVDAFLACGPGMVDFFERETAVRFVPGLAMPDFHSDIPGAGIGRGLCAAPFDARQLGGLVAKLRPPLREITVGGMAIAAGNDLKHFMNATTSAASALYAAGRFARHGLDMLRHRRSMHLVNGNALAARLLKSAATCGVRMWADARVEALVMADGAVAGARVALSDGAMSITARRGVVLACGGFPYDVERTREWLPPLPSRDPLSVAPQSNTGDGLRLAEEAGAALDAGMLSRAAWCPISRLPRRDGSTTIFPHLIDRARPGVIAVMRSGRRFVNEACSYHDFAVALLAATPPGREAKGFLIADQRTIRRYGLGFVKPFPLPLSMHVRSGYLRRGATIPALAQACGVDAEALAATIETYNRGARDGVDPEFGKGTTPFNRAGGDPERKPNPCVAPVEVAPFYAIEILPGSLGTFAGIRTDALARALRDDGTPVRGLYAVGSDMASVMAGRYPAGGITLGPAMTFGFIAGHHLAGVAIDRSPQSAYAPEALGQT